MPTSEQKQASASQMIAEPLQQSYTSSKYYQLTTILEHMLDCFHTIVSDETNPYHPQLAWLSRKPRPADDELFMDLMDECSRDWSTFRPSSSSSSGSSSSSSSPIIRGSFDENTVQLSASVRSRLERYSSGQRQEIVSRTKAGCAPLFMACKNGLTSVARYLIELCNADVEQRGRYEALEDHHTHSVSPIWVASVCCRPETVRLLIRAGANVNSLSDTGSTPLRSTCYLCHDLSAPVPSELEENREDEGDDNHQDQIDQQALRGWAALEANDYQDQRRPTAREDPHMEIIKLLLDNGADLELANYRGSTCLMNSFNNVKLAEYILNLGADVNITDNQNKTALHYAIEKSNLELVKLLLSRGADPLIQTKPHGDDALQLCCISGHEEMFEYLVASHTYPTARLVDAYRLLGSSILEAHFDLGRVRRLWQISLVIEQQQLGPPEQETSSPSLDQGSSSINYPSNSTHQCDRTTTATTTTFERRRRRLTALGDAREFTGPHELEAMSAENFRLQSLLISERVLGTTHQETTKRLLDRGNFYINSLRFDRCIDLWIYALDLRPLSSESIFHLDFIYAAQGICKLFTDLLNQRRQLYPAYDRHHHLHHHHPRPLDPHDPAAAAPLDQAPQVKFCDVRDVLAILLPRLDACREHLAWRPRFSLHEEMFDLLLDVIVQLALALKCVARQQHELDEWQRLVGELARANPRNCSTGASLLHVCLKADIFDCDSFRTSALDPEHCPGDIPGGPRAPPTVTNDNHRRSHEPSASGPGGDRLPSRPIIRLIESLIDQGLDVDQPNRDGLSPLQCLCLSAGIRSADRKRAIQLLVAKGAHVDRRTASPEQADLIGLALREAEVGVFERVTLACLAARQVARHRARLFRDERDYEQTLAANLRQSIGTH